MNDSDGEDDTHTLGLNDLVEKCIDQNDLPEGVAKIDGVHTPPYTTVAEKQIMSQTMDDFTKTLIPRSPDSLKLDKKDEDRIENMNNLDSNNNIKKEETSDETTAMADSSPKNGRTRSEDEFEVNKAEKHASKPPSIEARSPFSKNLPNPTGAILHLGSWDPSQAYEQGSKDSLPNANNITAKTSDNVSSPRLREGLLEPLSVQAGVLSKNGNPKSQSTSGLPALIQNPNSIQPQQTSPKESIAGELCDSSRIVSSPRYFDLKC